jgi:ABC-type transport system involved in multi-copper enzyme maturation permease subunit
MNYLPVVGRELRVAARKRSSFWLRVAAAATALAVGAFLLILNRTQGVGTPALGSELFYALAWMCLAVGLCSGLFFTSDCLSEEKREGTLGLLFLTELRGFDVVLGKLLATSLRGGYALLAVLPVIALTQLMGGVTGPQYWKSSLALLNALFCSLSAGMFVSVLARDSQKALAGTFLLLLLLALGGPCADLALAGIRHRGFQPVWSLSSPGYVLAVAGAWGGSPYDGTHWV